MTPNTYDQSDSSNAMAWFRGLTLKLAKANLNNLEQKHNIEEKNGAIAEKNRVIAEKDRVIAEKDRAIEDLKKILKTKEELIKTQKQIIGDLCEWSTFTKLL